MQDDYTAQLPATADAFPSLPLEGGLADLDALASAPPPPVAPTESPASRKSNGKPVARADLSSPEKAAIIVRLLLDQGADIPLEELPEELQARLTKQMGQMSLVDRDTLEAVAQEFAETLDGVGLSFRNGMAGALESLDGRISAGTAARLRKEAGVRQKGDPWPRLCALEVPDLAGIMQSESVEVAAVLLSKLETAKAAQVLGKLPGPQARQITYAMSLTRGVTPEAVERIGLSLAAQVDARPDIAFADGPDQRLGAILNQTSGATRDDVLTALDEADSVFAASVRKAIFTFENLPERVNEIDVPQIARAVDQPVLVAALTGAQAAGLHDAMDFVLNNMSARMADALRDEIAERGVVKPSEGEAAMSQVIEAVRALEATGGLTLKTSDDEDE